VKGLVKVDLETLELQASGICHLRGNDVIESLILDLQSSTFGSNIATAEVRRSFCYTRVRLSHAAQYKTVVHILQTCV
jgi:hypothetical protein